MNDGDFEALIRSLRGSPDTSAARKGPKELSITLPTGQELYVFTDINLPRAPGIVDRTILLLKPEKLESFKQTDKADVITSDAVLASRGGRVLTVQSLNDRHLEELTYGDDGILIIFNGKPKDPGSGEIIADLYPVLDQAGVSPLLQKINSVVRSSIMQKADVLKQSGYSRSQLAVVFLIAHAKDVADDVHVKTFNTLMHEFNSGPPAKDGYALFQLKVPFESYTK